MSPIDDSERRVYKGQQPNQWIGARENPRGRRRYDERPKVHDVRGQLAAAVCLSAMVLGCSRSSPQEFRGTLEPELAPGRIATSIPIAPADARAALAPWLRSDDRVFASSVSVGETKRPVYLVLSAGDARSVAADLDGNGTIDERERIPLAAVTDPHVVLAATLLFDTAGKLFAHYPVRIGLSKEELAAIGEPMPAARLYLSTSYQAFATGVVPVDGKPVKVQVIADAKEFTVNPSKSYQYLDCDGDGTFDTDFTSWEMGYGRGAPVVFHVGDGDRYVSIESVEPAARTITLRTRAAADYQRIELRMGSTLPDFAFTSLDGSPHQLSELRGKYVLIDFWGTWCGPCVGEIPYLKLAYEHYKSKGLEILGMDNELPDVTTEDFAKGLDKVKGFVAERGVTWMQARTESIKPLYETRFQVVAWPTLILLNPAGQIISVDRTGKGEPGLRGDALGRTLATLFGDGKATPQ
jgi:thiol-disulfide isomerase/thioredoxin